MHAYTTTLFPGSLLMKVPGGQRTAPSRLLFFLQEMRALLSLLPGVLAILLMAVPAVADSRARIVRLSELEGDIQIDRGTGEGFERAVMNLPITEGSKFRAGYDGFAELEFEDGSTVRFTPGTILEISQLVLRDSGAKATTVNVLYGVAYVTYEGTKNDEFLLMFDDEKTALIKSERLRLEVGHAKSRLSVLGGAAVQVEQPSGTIEVEKKHAVTFAMDGQTPPSSAAALTKIAYDQWDERQFEYHERYGQSGKYQVAPYAFGGSDLNYFGHYINDPVCGVVWRPYLAGATWDPFAAGTWFWYSGSGYSWVSGFPWGWLPFHSGSWQFCPGNGWSWQPGTTWAGLDNYPRLPRARMPIHMPIRPPEPPRGPGQPIHAERRLLPIPELAQRLVIRNDSAGVGIPRGSIPNLSKLSQQVEHHGPVNAVVYAQPGNAQVRFEGARPGSSDSSWRQGSGSLSSSGAYQHQGSGATSATGSGATNTTGSGSHSNPASGGSIGSSSGAMGAGGGSSASAPRSGGAQTTPK